ncbi:MAG: hypothetical protein FDZ75_01450 [Actinobacteria bacterium]|nr:MAG: hypothetical protein FDZ75_01450 [Actinomycetota bacterium]
MNFGPYEVVQELGRGGMAVVWLGYDAALDRNVAIKELVPPPGVSETVADDMAHRFVAEARAVARLDHPSIVTIYTAGEFDGRSAIVMELLDGETLHQILGRGRLPHDYVSSSVSQLLDAIGHAHSHGVIHRDIKPDNIFLLRSGRLKLADFGVAHLATGGRTQIGTVIGTPGYMSPEQVLGQPVDGRSDLFSVGVVAYEMLVGYNPFGNSDVDPVPTIMYRIAHEQPAEVRELLPEVPRQLSATIAMLLAKDPAARPQDAAHALRLWTGQERVPGGTGLFGIRAPQRPMTVPPAPASAQGPAAPSATVIEMPTVGPEPIAEPEPAIPVQDAAVEQSEPAAAEPEVLVGSGVGENEESSPEAVLPLESHEPAVAIEVDGEPTPRRSKHAGLYIGIAAALGLAVALLAFNAVSGNGGGGGGGGTAAAVRATTTTDTAAQPDPPEPAPAPVAVSAKLSSTGTSLKRTPEKTSAPGAPATLIATVRSKDGGPAKGTVRFDARESGSTAWKVVVKAVKLNGAGTAKTTVRPKKNTSYRAVYAGSTKFDQSVSRPVTVAVGTRVIRSGGSPGGSSSSPRSTRPSRGSSGGGSSPPPAPLDPVL